MTAEIIDISERSAQKKPASCELKQVLSNAGVEVRDLRPQDYFLGVANHPDFGPTFTERFVEAIGQHIEKRGLEETLNGLRRHWYDAQKPTDK